MKLLADVNVDKAIVRALRADGHDVVWVTEDRMRRRASDDLLLLHAYRDGQVVITNDKDFTRYVLIDLMPAHGVVLSRMALPGASRAEVVRRVLDAFRACQSRLLGQFTTIYPDRVEQRPLPLLPTSPPLPHP